jgi:hypothetical protein
LRQRLNHSWSSSPATLQPPGAASSPLFISNDFFRPSVPSLTGSQHMLLEVSAHDLLAVTCFSYSPCSCMQFDPPIYAILSSSSLFCVTSLLGYPGSTPPSAQFDPPRSTNPQVLPIHARRTGSSTRRQGFRPSLSLLRSPLPIYLSIYLLHGGCSSLPT